MALDPPFITNRQRSRRRLSIGWMAAQKSTAPVIAPVSAWLSRPVVRRKSLKRHLLVSSALQWKYIAPTVAAILPRAKVIKIDYRRKVQATRTLVLSAPATGPPTILLAAPRVNRISHRKRLVLPQVQVSYPATPAPPQTSGLPVGTQFVTTITRSRKALVAKWIAALTAAATPGTSQAPIAALVANRLRRRKSRAGLFLSGSGAAAAISQSTTTAAVYPSFVQRPVFKISFKCKLIKVLQPAVFPATANPALYPSFVAKAANQVRYRRKLLSLAAPVGVAAVAPGTSPALYPAFLPPKAFRAKFDRKRLPLASPIGVAAATSAIAIAALVAAKTKRRTKFARKLLVVQAHRLFPPTPPPPVCSWQLVVPFVVSQRRVLLPQAPLLERPTTPPIVTPPPRCYFRLHYEIARFTVKRDKSRFTPKAER